MVEPPMLKLLILSIIATFASVSGFAQAADPGGTAKTSLAAIESLIRSQRYDEALEEAKSRLQETPADYRLWTVEGIVL
jgi:hypothetical protein